MAKVLFQWKMTLTGGDNICGWFERGFAAWAALSISKRSMRTFVKCDILYNILKPNIKIS